jgi:histidinol-phosphatase (PHP family)
MILAPDYHIHTCFSCDSETEMEAACEAAIARGLSEIAFADHADFEPLDPDCGFLRPAAYMAAIECCQRRYDHRLTIRAGVEVGEAHIYRDQVAELLNTHEFDVVLGSLHWIGGRLHCDGHYFDGRSLDDGLRGYLKHLARLAAEADYDVLAHFDTVRRAAAKAFGETRLDYAAHKETILGILRTLVERGKGLEVNTVTCRRGMGDPCPPLDVLRWYRELGGEILTFGSDAHTADAIASHFDVALEMARAAGFTWVATFEQRRIHWMRI